MVEVEDEAAAGLLNGVSRLENLPESVIRKIMSMMVPHTRHLLRRVSFSLLKAHDENFDVLTTLLTNENWDKFTKDFPERFKGLNRTRHPGLGYHIHTIDLTREFQVSPGFGQQVRILYMHQSPHYNIELGLTQCPELQGLYISDSGTFSMGPGSPQRGPNDPIIIVPRLKVLSIWANVDLITYLGSYGGFQFPNLEILKVSCREEMYGGTGRRSAARFRQNPLLHEDNLIIRDPGLTIDPSSNINNHHPETSSSSSENSQVKRYKKRGIYLLNLLSKVPTLKTLVIRESRLFDTDENDPAQRTQMETLMKDLHLFKTLECLAIDPSSSPLPRGGDGEWQFPQNATNFISQMTQLRKLDVDIDPITLSELGTILQRSQGTLEEVSLRLVSMKNYRDYNYMYQLPLGLRNENSPEPPTLLDLSGLAHFQKLRTLQITAPYLDKFVDLSQLPESLENLTMIATCSKDGLVQASEKLKNLQSLKVFSVWSDGSSGGVAEMTQGTLSLIFLFNNPNLMTLDLNLMMMDGNPTDAQEYYSSLSNSYFNYPKGALKLLYPSN